jgi:hypothetical protein
MQFRCDSCPEQNFVSWFESDLVGCKTLILKLSEVLRMVGIERPYIHLSLDLSPKWKGWHSRDIQLTNFPSFAVAPAPRYLPEPQRNRAVNNNQ